jgi:flagellar biogenesis protein FliO
MRTFIFMVSLLVVPLALLLFAQWPLRELVQAYSRQANDAAQILFAVYAAVAVTAASISNGHLSAASPVAGCASGSGRFSGWRPWALLACVGPWSAFTLWAAWPQVAASVAGFERFGDTLTPGFFVVKLALALMLILILLESLLRIVQHRRAHQSGSAT